MAQVKQLANAPSERQKFYFQFVTTPTSDTPGTTLLLHFNNRRYFFGRIAEGTQRACIQRGIGIKKVRNLFLTGPTTWSNMGGLIGMILTMADVQHDEKDPVTGKRPVLRIQGGPKLTHSIACARRFVFRTGMPLQIHEADMKSITFDDPSYSDDNITVCSLPVARRSRSGTSSPKVLEGRSQSPDTVGREQVLRAETVRNMFDSDWRKDRLVESRFDQVKLPALIWVRHSGTKELVSTQCSTMADAPHLQPESKVLVRNPWPASLISDLPSADNFAGSVSMSYIVRGKPQRGRFMPQKAKQLGVKPGPNFALLTAGGSVTLENGTVITSDMVLGDTEPGKGMAILDVPTEEYLQDLSEKLESLDKSIMEGVTAAAWLLGPDVASSSAFATLLGSLPGIQHIISSSDMSPDYLALDSAAASSIRLAQIRPECFVVPVHSNDLVPREPSLTGIEYVLAARGLIVQVAPKPSLVRSEIPPLLDIEATKNSYHEVLKDLIPAPATTEGTGGLYDDVQILTLGTGSAVPSKYRNVSATLVRIPGQGSYLFDCGENTLGMLQRAFSAEELEEVLLDLKMIWISHLHADHHLGTLSVIAAKKHVMDNRGQSEPKLYVVSEPNMADYLNDYRSVQSSPHCRLLGVLNSDFVTKDASHPSTPTHISQTQLPIKEFLTTRVSHCHGAQACSVTFNNGFKFSYSGDCRPSAHFARIGQGSDVLLHEATFDDGLEGDAMAKKHSTTGEALAVAHAMKAKNVVLTHFSQRYQKIPVLSSVKFGEVRFEEGDNGEDAGPIEENIPAQTNDHESNESTRLSGATPFTETTALDSVENLQKVARDMNVCVAFDLMSVKVGQIHDMYKYYPAIEKMFELEHEKSEAKKDERRGENDRMREDKEKKQNKWTDEATKKNASTVPKGGDIYQKINGHKVKGSKDANNLPPGDITGDNHISGDSNTPGGKSNTAASNRTKKRQAKQTHQAQGKQIVKDSTPRSSSSSKDTNKSARQLSVEPETSINKRVKLDEETT